MQGDLTTLNVAMFPFFVNLVVPALCGALLEVVNHFFKIWDSHDKFLDVFLVVTFTVLFVSFIAFFFVVMNTNFCA